MYRRMVGGRVRGGWEPEAGPVEWAANVHHAAAIPNLLMAETIETPFHSALIRDSITIDNGYILPPTTPALGIDVDEALARAHPSTGTCPLYTSPSPLDRTSSRMPSSP